MTDEGDSEDIVYYVIVLIKFLVRIVYLVDLFCNLIQFICSLITTQKITKELLIF
jgi:hypothetical protein